MPVVRCSDGASGMLTFAFVPLNEQRLADTSRSSSRSRWRSCPVRPLPEASVTVVPVPSSNAYAATSSGIVASVVTVATFEYGPRLLARILGAHDVAVGRVGRQAAVAEGRPGRRSNLHEADVGAHADAPLDAIVRHPDVVGRRPPRQVDVCAVRRDGVSVPGAGGCRRVRHGNRRQVSGRRCSMCWCRLHR